MLERLRPFIQRIVDELLDQAQWKGRIEVIGDFSFLFPITVIAELLGIPVEMREQLKVGPPESSSSFSCPGPCCRLRRDRKVRCGSFVSTSKVCFATDTPIRATI
ncbi:MAG: hypothetical protein O3A51_08825 [Verrucomicrobia bacterium]|nr:hypothetical protein [Verrucomicrobiota bacterium]